MSNLPLACARPQPASGAMDSAIYSSSAHRRFCPACARQSCQFQAFLQRPPERPFARCRLIGEERGPHDFHVSRSSDRHRDDVDIRIFDQISPVVVTSLGMMECGGRFGGLSARSRKRVDVKTVNSSNCRNMGYAAPTVAGYGSGSNDACFENVPGSHADPSVMIAQGAFQFRPTETAPRSQPAGGSAFTPCRQIPATPDGWPIKSSIGARRVPELLASTGDGPGPNYLRHPSQSVRVTGSRPPHASSGTAARLDGMTSWPSEKSRMKLMRRGFQIAGSIRSA